MALSISSLMQTNAKRWDAAKLTRSSEYTVPVSRILAAKNRYERVQAMTGVHWVFTACSHYRESNLNFNRQLGQGDPINQVSTHVPKGRGPFNSFEDSAYDALVNCAPYAARVKDWSMPGMLTILEMYNGLGYARRTIPSPYVWSGTDQYQRGKYVADGVFDANTVDKQLGVAGLILSLDKADDTISYTKGALPSAIEPKALPTPSGPILNKEGEDISDFLHELGHDVWTWLKEH